MPHHLLFALGDLLERLNTLFDKIVHPGSGLGDAVSRRPDLEDRDRATCGDGRRPFDAGRLDGLPRDADRSFCVGASDRWLNVRTIAPPFLSCRCLRALRFYWCRQEDCGSPPAAAGDASLWSSCFSLMVISIARGRRTMCATDARSGLGRCPAMRLRLSSWSSLLSFDPFRSRQRADRHRDCWPRRSPGSDQSLLLLRPIERKGTNEPAHGDADGDIAIGYRRDDARRQESHGARKRTCRTTFCSRSAISSND